MRMIPPAVMPTKDILASESCPQQAMTLPREPPGELEALLEHGVGLHNVGRLDEAANVYSLILSKSPKHFDAMHLLGVIALQQGRLDTAISLIETALVENPQDAAALGNLGTSYLRNGKVERALQSFAMALELQPDSLNALTNVGTALHHMHRHREAIPVLRKAHALDSNSYAIASLLGSCLIKCGESREATELFLRATHAEPDNPEGFTNLAIAMNACGRHTEAQEYAAKAVSLDPKIPAALCALGAAQFSQGLIAEAIENYRHGVAGPHPTAQMLLEFGNALLSGGLNEEAIEQFRRVVNLDEGSLQARWAKALASLKPIYASELDMSASRRLFATELADVERWYVNSSAIEEPFRAVGLCQPFYLAYQPLNNRALLRQYGTLCTQWMNTLPGAIGVQGNGDHAGKVRIGFVTSHVHEHSVWNAITKGWIDHLDRDQFEVSVFHLGDTSDSETERVRQNVDHFEDGPKDLGSWVKGITERNLAVILYPEIGMHALTLQLASLRLAPVQAASWGHPETTGLPTMDYYISAELLEPAHAERNYTEKLIRLPNLGVHVKPLAPTIAKPNLRSLYVPRNEPLLLCPGAPFKYSPLYDDALVQIARRMEKRFLKRHSGGRLVLFKSRSAIMDQMLETRLRAAFDAGGVDFDSHVNIIPHLDRSRFYGLMRESALMLDTIGFSGFNTALQAVECGLPLLAYEGDFMRGRLASAVLRHLGLPELVATTKEDFVNKAAELAANPDERRRLSSMITERRNALFNDLEAVRGLERQLTAAVLRVRSKAALQS